MNRSNVRALWYHPCIWCLRCAFISLGKFDCVANITCIINAMLCSAMQCSVYYSSYDMPTYSNFASMYIQTATNVLEQHLLHY